MKATKELLTSLTALCLCLLFIGWTPLDVLYFTNSELQSNGLRAPMYPDSGKRIRSNDTLLFLGGYNYYSRYYSAQDTYLVVGEGQPHFENEIQLGVDSLFMNGDLRSIRANANPFITDGHGRLMTWIQLEGDNGIVVYQYPKGLDRLEYVYCTLGVPNWQSIFVDGDCEVEGTLSGSLSIGCSGNMWLLDDVRYTNSSRYTGDFNENDRRIGMLTLASEQNIIIKDTYRNGKENGRDVGGQDFNRHSIVLTAAIYCPNGSFTFEHQNDDWDGYQGPWPDERGWVWLKGCLIQNQRGVLHSPNHGGTGYGIAFRKDRRFDGSFLGNGRTSYLNGELGDLELDTNHIYYVGEATVRDLTILPEHQVVFQADSRLTVRGRLELMGREDAQATLFFDPSEDGPAELIFAGRARNSLVFDHAVVEEGISLDLTSDTISILSSVINSTLHVSGNLLLEASTFHNDVILGRAGRGTVVRNLFFEQFSTTAYGWQLDLINNTFIEPTTSAIHLESGANVNIINNIIYGGREGIVCEGLVPPVVGYNLIYGFQRQAYFGCQPGEGALETDPLFVDEHAGDFRLSPNSPCIDAGDPASTRDPDGTVADLGAFWLDRGLGNDDDSAGRRPRLPAEMSASPNPFNATTVIRFTVGERHAVPLRIAIYDLAGQEVFSAVSPPRLTADTFTWNATAFPAGIYIVRVESGKDMQTMKIVKVN